MLYKQKGNFQKIVRWLAGSWMTANMATVFGFCFIIFISACFYSGLSLPGARFVLLFIPVFLIFRMGMNALDGMLAREYGTASVTGEIWNEALDIIGDTVAYGSLYFVENGPKTAIFLFLILSWCAEFFGVLGKSLPNGVRRHEALLGGKPDRAIWMGLLSILLFIFPSFLRFSQFYIYGISVFVLVTIFLRIRKIITESKNQEYESYTWIGR